LNSDSEVKEQTCQGNAESAYENGDHLYSEVIGSKSRIQSKEDGSYGHTDQNSSAIKQKPTTDPL
jgi:hypothetical protein